MIAVCDSSPLIGLAKAGRLDLLHRLYDEILIPEMVHGDVVVRGRGRRGARMVANAVALHRIRVLAVNDPGLIPNRLIGTGEGEAIALCREVRADLLIADDRLAVMEAARLNLPCISTVGVIRDAKIRGVIRRAKPILVRMVDNGFGIGDFDAVIADLGE